MHELCRVTTGNYEIGNKPSFGEKIPKKVVTKIKAWHRPLDWAQRQGVQPHTVGMSPRLNTSFGMISLCLPRCLGKGWLNLLRLAPTQPNPSSKALLKHGGLGTSFVGETIFRSLGTWRGNVARVLVFCRSLDGLGVLLGFGVLVGCLCWDSYFLPLLILTWQCGASEGVLLSKWVCLHLVPYAIWRWFLAFCLQKNLRYSKYKIAQSI